MKGLVLTYYGNFTIKLKNNLREVAEWEGQINEGGNIWEGGS